MKTTIGILLAIAAAFVIIILATDAVSLAFGKTGELIALGVVAIILLVALIKNKGDK